MSRVVCFSLVLTAGLAAGDARGGCPAPVAIQNLAIGTPAAGGFDVSGTAFAGKGTPGPAIRFWAFGHHADANSGSQAQFDAESPFLVNPAIDYKMEGTSPDVFSLFQANWFGPEVKGCILDLEVDQRRTVVELSFADPAREKSADHAGYYAIASVPWDTGFNFDQVQGAGGKGGNVVPVKPIPAPRLLGAPAPAGDGFVQVSVELPEPVSYSEKGMNQPVSLVKGYRVLYAAGDEPQTSDPQAYRPVLDPKDPKRELGTLPPGKAAVAVPAGAKVWLVSQLVYADPAAVHSGAVSSHVTPGEKDAPAGRTRGGGSRSR